MENIYITIILLIMSLSSNAQHSGQQAIFNATDSSYIDYGKGVNLRGYNSEISNGKYMTITLWLKWCKKPVDTIAVADSWANLFTLTDTTKVDDGVFWVQHNQNNNKIEFALEVQDTASITNRQYIQSITNPQEGVWYHVACVYDATISKENMKLYINGVKEQVRNITGNIRTFTPKTKLNVGRCPARFRKFNGMLDEISVWSRALDSIEIKKIMNNPESVTLSDYKAPKLIGYYNFDNGTANDLTPTGNNGTNAGGTTFTNNSYLPIELLSFTAECDNNIIFNWITASEINNNYFTVEYSENMISFVGIGDINSYGNSINTRYYTFKSNSNKNGYYRLKQTDFDGKIETFDAIYVNCLDVKINHIIIPNPIILEDLKALFNSNMILYDINGRYVNINNVAKGLYFLKYDNTFIQKVIVN